MDWMLILKAFAILMICAFVWVAMFARSEIKRNDALGQDGGHDFD